MFVRHTLRSTQLAVAGSSVDGANLLSEKSTGGWWLMLMLIWCGRKALLVGWLTSQLNKTIYLDEQMKTHTEHNNGTERIPELRSSRKEIVHEIGTTILQQKH